MTSEIKHLIHTPSKDVYQMEEGQDTFTFSISKGETTIIREPSAPFLGKPFSVHADFVELDLSCNGNSLYNLKQCEDSRQEKANTMAHIETAIAEKLYDDKTKEVTVIKEFLHQISDNLIVDNIRNYLNDTPQRREQAAKIGKFLKTGFKRTFDNIKRDR